MPDFKNRNDIEFAKYDAMSTEELQALLREDASKPEGDETNMEVLFYVMEVLAKRRQARQEGKTPEEALESFVKNYMPEAEDASSSESDATVRRHKPVVRRWMSGLVAVAAMLVLVFSMSLTASAFGYDLWEVIVKWTQDTFHFGYSMEDPEIRNPNIDKVEAFCGLQNALDDYDIVVDLAPSKFPDGYEEIDVRVEDTPLQRRFIAKYQSGSGTIRIRLVDYLDEDPTQIEQSDSLIEVYSSGGVDYYIFQNEDQLQAIWINESFECFISGPINLSEIKEIIDSIEKG